MKINKNGIPSMNEEKIKLGNIGRFSFIMLLLSGLLILALIMNVNIGSVSIADMHRSLKQL